MREAEIEEQKEGERENEKGEKESEMKNMKCVSLSVPKLLTFSSIWCNRNIRNIRTYTYIVHRQM